MRIVYIASVRIPNEKASGLAIMRQCEGFASLGHTVTLVRPYRTNHISAAPFEYYSIPEIFTVKTLRSLDFKECLGRFGFYIARLSQMIAGLVYLCTHRNDIDVIYARDPWMLVLPVFFLRKKKIIWEAHQAQSGFFMRFVAKCVHRMVCISEGLKIFYASQHPYEICFEPSGVNLEQFKHMPLVAEARQKFSIPSSAQVVGYIGKYKTMGEEKGVDDLIKACAQVGKHHEKLHVFIAGLEAEEIPLVELVCRDAGLTEGSYTLVPLIQKDFVYYVQVADVLVMNYPDTPHYRDFMSPTKLFAYMGSKKKVVASDLPSIRSIADESLITLVAPDDIQSLAEGIREAITDSDKNKQDRAYQRVMEHAWKSRSERILQHIIE